MDICFLLINERCDKNWRLVLEESLSSLGKLHVVSIEEALIQISDIECEVLIIDATVVEEVELLIARLRAKRPDSRIVVMTASPTWRRARAAFEAGAIDYIPKSFSKTKIHDTFKQILQRPLPPWSR